MYIHEKSKSIAFQTGGDLLPNGWSQFKIQVRKTGFWHGLNGLKMVILVIVELLIKVFLSYVFTLEQATESILGR